MVLRGSGTKPDGSIPDERAALHDAREQLKSIETAIEHEKNEIVSKVADVAVELESKGVATSVVGATIARHKSIADSGKQIRVLETKREKVVSDIESNRKALEKTVKQIICGGTAGAIARTTVAPADRVKILMQVAYVQKKQDQFDTIAKTIRHIVANEGVTGLWRGNLTNCVRVVPHAATQFVTYDKIKVYLCGNSNGTLNTPQKLFTGSAAGIVAATFTQPLDVVRVRLQTDKDVGGSVRKAARTMYAENGVRAFYKGYVPAMLSLSPFIAINFATFDTLKTWWYGSGTFTKEELKQRNPAVPLVLGATAGIVAQTFCYPLDTVRRRMQVKEVVYSSTVQAFVTIARVEGVRGFYRGMLTNALKVMPNNALRFAVYETLVNWFVADGSDGGSAGASNSA